MPDTRSIRTTRCSLVVAPVDIWTRRIPAPSALTVALVGVHRKPIRKPNGTYLFLDLPDDSYLLNIYSPSFIPVNQWIETGHLNTLHPVVTVPLLPGPGYLYPANSTALRFQLIDSSGVGRSDVDVYAYVKEDAALSQQRESVL